MRPVLLSFFLGSASLMAAEIPMSDIVCAHTARVELLGDRSMSLGLELTQHKNPLSGVSHSQKVRLGSFYSSTYGRKDYEDMAQKWNAELKKPEARLWPILLERDERGHLKDLRVASPSDLAAIRKSVEKMPVSSQRDYYLARLNSKPPKYMCGDPENIPRADEEEIKVSFPPLHKK